MSLCRTGIVAMTVGMALLAASPGRAQFTNGNAGATGMGAAANRNLRGAANTPGAANVAAPPVLPGTKTAPEAAAPTVSPADMSPTDALFDAINRGDLPAAREAVNRGANLGGENLLGLTPLDLAVDLGRNDISFLLLSMRGEDAGARNVARRGQEPGAPDQSRAEAPRRAARSRVAAVIPRPADEPVVATPRLYSGNGGTPIPAAGFLGFDEGRSVR